MTNHHHKLSTVADRHEHSHHEEDEDVLHEDLLPALVFDASFLGEDVPNGFNAVKVVLDGSLKADLKWDKERSAVEKYVKQGLHIFWDIHLCVFNQLEKPIGNQSQFLSLCLSLEHFRDTLWKEFRTHTIGICVYGGNPDFKVNFPWDEDQLINLQGWLKDLFGDVSSFAHEIGCDVSAFSHITSQSLCSTEEGNSLLSLFCRDVAAEYLDLLVDRLPDTLKCFLLMDGSHISNTSLWAQLTTKERYPRFILGLTGLNGNHANLDGFVWNDSTGHIGLLTRNSNSTQEITTSVVGVCLPSITLCRPSAWKDLEEVFNLLNTHSIQFRTIPEISLTTEWDGLDYLIVSSKNLTIQGRRKLQGFCAAGGTVITIGNLIGLPQEVSWVSGMPLLVDRLT